MDYDDIIQRNDSMPYYPKEMSLWQRILCILGYHKAEKRMAKNHRIGNGEIIDLPLRDQCSRCHALL